MEAPKFVNQDPPPPMAPREPPPTQEEYYLPRCESPPRVPLGKFPKDTGLTSSRLADIEKQAKKTPGPGMYVRPQTWNSKDKTKGARKPYETCKNFGNQFGLANRFRFDATTMVKKRGHTPGPGHYESKEVNMKPINAVHPKLSDMKRCVLGMMPKSAKETYIDRIGKTGPVSPSCSKYAYISKSAVLRNKFDLHTPSLGWTQSKTASRKDPKAVPPSLASNHYHIKYATTDQRPLDISFPKGKDVNFIDKQTRSKGYLPAPGKYDLIKLDKITRATKYLQVNNVGRSALSGLF